MLRESSWAGFRNISTERQTRRLTATAVGSAPGCTGPGTLPSQVALRGDSLLLLVVRCPQFSKAKSLRVPARHRAAYEFPSLLPAARRTGRILPLLFLHRDRGPGNLV